MNHSEIIPVASTSAEHAHLSVHPCPACGGRWKVRMQALMKGNHGHYYDRVDVRCRECGGRGSFLFDISSFFPGQQV